MHTLEELKAELWLDKNIWRFFWYRPGRFRKASLEAGSFDAYGYGQVRLQGKTYKEHRLVWLFVTGSWPNGHIDHINHDRRDNRFENLRVVTNQENCTNRVRARNNKSGFTGVWFDSRSNKYLAYICTNGFQTNLGYFEKIEDAIGARVLAMKENGFHENHGKELSEPRRNHKKSKNMEI